MKKFPVQKNELFYGVHITDLGEGGTGIGHIALETEQTEAGTPCQQYTLFVRHALPGDVVTVRITKAKSNQPISSLLRCIYFHILTERILRHDLKLPSARLQVEGHCHHPMTQPPNTQLSHLQSRTKTERQSRSMCMCAKLPQSCPTL